MKASLILFLLAGLSFAGDRAGQQQYIICGACHGQSGEGTAAGPPLAGSEWVNGPAENLIRIQLRGLQGPIKVKGVEYHFPAGMIALAHQTDEQIASVLTYIRSSFGNDAPAVQPEEIAALRHEIGQPPVTVADLIPVFDEDAPVPASSKYDTLDTGGSTSPWIVIGALALLLGGGFLFLKRA